MTNIHEIELYINGKNVDIGKDLNIRLNNLFSDPTKMENNVAEYSYSFTLPVTENNALIFDFANIPSKRNKFNKKYPAQLIVDGSEIFKGQILLSSITNEEFDCNLIVNKLKTFEQIFGDDKLSDIKGFEIEYHQPNETDDDTGRDLPITINQMNSASNITYPQECFFPLVSYGVFQKEPYDADKNYYTSKFLIDNTCKFYNESFYPSINLLKTIERAFNYKGYSVGGNIFDDEVLKKIYMSTNVSEGQDPQYNLGGNLGKLSFRFNFRNMANYPTKTYHKYADENIADRALHTIVDLPEDYIAYDGTGDNQKAVWDKCNAYDVWGNPSLYIDSSTQTLVKFANTYHVSNDNIFRNGSVVIPSDGYYKIKLDTSINVLTNFKPFTMRRWVGGSVNKDVDFVYGGTAYPWIYNLANFKGELQLVKNYDDTIGLIAPQAINKSGHYPTYYRKNERYDTNYYPHEAKQFWEGERKYSYMPKDNYVMQAYDPKANPNFLMGRSFCFPYMNMATIKNGRSWDRTVIDENRSAFNCDSYLKFDLTTWASGHTDYNKTTLKNSKCSGSTSPDDDYGNYTTIDSYFETIVYLKKNDILSLRLFTQRHRNAAEEDSDIEQSDKWYPTGYMHDGPLVVSGNFSIEAYKKDTIENRNDIQNFDYSGDTEFDKNLNLANFLNGDERISDFVNNFIKEFNLTYSQNDNLIVFDKNNFKKSVEQNVIDLTNRVTEYTLEDLEFPKSKQIKYTINDEERGVYISAEKNATGYQMESENFADYADKGSDKVIIEENGDGDELEITTKTSYNWYEKFNLEYFTIDKEMIAEYDLPIIAKDEWMIEGLNYEDAMKKSGVTLKRRYWFPDAQTQNYVEMFGKPIYLTTCKDIFNNTELSYHTHSENASETLLTRYFDTNVDTSTNSIIFECYLNILEYQQIKNGSLVKVDDDIYRVIEINGYDPSGKEKCEITAYKL